MMERPTILGGELYISRRDPVTLMDGFVRVLFRSFPISASWADDVVRILKVAAESGNTAAPTDSGGQGQGEP